MSVVLKYIVESCIPKALQPKVQKLSSPKALKKPQVLKLKRQHPPSTQTLKP